MKQRKQAPFLEIKIRGPAVKPGRIRLDDLLCLVEHIENALERTAKVLLGSSSLKPGARPHDLKTACSLELVGISQGSPATSLRFERTDVQTKFPSMDFGFEVMEKCFGGLAQVSGEAAPLPAGYDPGVLMAWKDAGRIFSRGISDIEITLNHRTEPLRVRFDQTTQDQIRDRIRGPERCLRTIEGRLLMADFKEHGTRCRIHPSTGSPVICLFDDSLRDEVYRNILKFVRVTGETKENSFTGRIEAIVISDIEPIEAMDDEVAKSLPSGAPLPATFWNPPTFEQLAEAQGVKPVTTLESILGGWPEDEINDGFEDAVEAWRQDELVRER
jgi:hypothetical protein